MSTYSLRRFVTDQNEYDTEQSTVTRLVTAQSPLEAAMHVAGMVARTELTRRANPLFEMLAAAPTAGSWEYDHIRYTLRKIED